MPPQPPPRFTNSFAAYIAFFLSGASSLIFQTIWTRHLHHVFGATSVAISTVLTVFMAGLGLGAWLGGRYANRIKHPIITYAIAEVGVGLWGLLIPLMVRNDGWLADVNAWLAGELGAGSGWHTIARFACVAPILLVPTTLMGSTLPLLTRHFVTERQDARSAGARVGVLYALNTFGAASGPILSAFILLPTVHLTITNLIACSMNFALATLIFVFYWVLRDPSRRGEKMSFLPGPVELDTPEPVDVKPPADAVLDVAPPPEEPKPAEKVGELPKKKKKKKRKPEPLAEDAPLSEAPKKPARLSKPPASPAEEKDAPIPELARKAAFVAFAASGTAALAYEVVWSRALAMTIGTSIYSFALILETFLIGIAGGAAAMSALMGSRSRPLVGLSIASLALIFLANVPWALDIVDPTDQERRLDGGAEKYFLLSLFYAAPVVFAAVWSIMRESREKTEADAFRNTELWRLILTCVVAAMPVLAAGVNALTFPGYLPQIIFSVVACIAIFLVLAALLNRTPTLLLAIIQLFIAGATMVSYIWQDEVPRAFAQLVIGIPSGGHEDWARALADHTGTVKVFMWLTVVLCTLPATLGMGAMFPLTVRIWSSGGAKIARDVANVYTGNTVGSIVGAWLPGFMLLALIGAERTLHLGIALNMVLALLLLIAGVADPNEEQDFWSWRRLIAVGLPAVTALAFAPTLFPPDFHSWKWGTGVAATFMLMSLAVAEHQWLRARYDRRASPDRRAWIPIVALPALVVFPLALTFLAGPGEHDPWALRALFGALRALIVGTGLAVVMANWRELRTELPPFASVPKETKPAREAGWGPVLVAFGVLLLAGGLFFFAWDVFTEEASTQIWILPRLLVKIVLCVLGTGIGAFGGVLLATRGEEEAVEEDLPLWHAITVYILAPLIPALLAGLYVGTRTHDAPLRWDRTHMTLGVFRLSYAQDMVNEESWGAPELVYYNDGLTTTVSVERWGRHYALKNNGKVDASNGDDMPTQINVASYPLMLHHRGPRDLDVAIIGFGSGVTVGTVLKFPVRRVDVIELEHSIIEAARFFEDVNHLDYTLPYWPYVDMDRLNIVNDDGRNYLASTRRQYDVIISEPSNPWITGVSDLFTVDHWRITKRRLRPGGIYCQWVQLYELAPENIKTIYRTFASQFRHVIVLSADDRSSDTVMLGSDRPIQLDLEHLRRTYRISGVAEELERGNIFSPFDVYARVLLSNRAEVLRYTQIEHHLRGSGWEADPTSVNIGPCPRSTCRREGAILNTDDNAHIEFAAPNDLIGFARYEGYLATIYSEDWPYGNLVSADAGRGADGRPVPILSGFGEGDDASRNYAELAMSMIAHGRYGWAGEFIERSDQVGRSRETAIASEVFLHLVTTSNEPAVHIEPPVPGPDMDRRTADQLIDGFEAVRESVDEGAYNAALVAMENIPAPLRLHSGPGMKLLYAYLLYKAAEGQIGYYRRAIEQLDDLTRTEEDYVLRHPEVYYYLARSYDAEGDFAGALRAMRTYVEARLAPLNDDGSEVPEPAAGEAPSTDEPGESNKDEHVDRG